MKNNLFIGIGLFIALIFFIVKIYHFFIKPQIETSFEKLESISQQLNKESNVQITSESRFDNSQVDIDPTTHSPRLTINMTLNKMDSKEISKDHLIQEMKPKLIETMCNEVYKTSKIQDSIIAIRYLGKDGLLVTTINLDYSQCQTH